LRQKFYEKLLNHDIEFFDHPDNSPGLIAASLEEDTNHLNALMTNILGVIFKNISTIALGIILAFTASWRCSLCVLGVVPLICLAGYAEGAAAVAMDDGNVPGGNIVQENIANLKTIRAMNTVSNTLERFNVEIDKKIPGMGVLVWESVAYGISTTLIFYVLGLVYYVGAVFMADYGLSYEGFNKSVFCLMFAAMAMGQATQFAGDAGVAGIACVRIYSFLEQPVKTKDPKRATELKEFNGRIEFVGAHFKYPTRNEKIFNNMNVVIEPGTNVAFCGPSGSGKSTIIQLLLRFYDLEKGEIYLGGSADDPMSRIEIHELSLKNLREIFGLVGQEPFLFNMSIRDNIKYNKYDLAEDVIYDACVQANAINFIEGDKERLEEGGEDEATGFDRSVGVKGSKLSGGQKQRLAIARV